VWTAEAYGSDAITPLAYVAAHTKRIRLGTGVMQLAARSPAMAAMQLGTLDALSGGGRVIGGLGVSGPQIVEGWYGAPWGNPKERMRDYVAILRKIFARGTSRRTRWQGDFLALPRSGCVGHGQAAEVDPALRAAAADLARHGREGDRDPDRRDRDGWLPFGLRPNNAKTFASCLEEASGARAAARAPATSRSRAACR